MPQLEQKENNNNKNFLIHPWQNFRGVFLQQKNAAESMVQSRKDVF